jgi:hypothetical protein
VYPRGLLHFTTSAKFTNFGLYYGITSIFLISFYDYIKIKVCRLFCLLILSADLYMLIVIAKRSLWIAFLVSFVFLFLMFKGKLLKFLLLFIPFFIFVGSVIFYFDHREPWMNISSTVEGAGLFMVANLPTQNEPLKVSPKIGVPSADIPVKNSPVEVFPGEKFMVANLPTQNEPLKVSPKIGVPSADIPVKNSPVEVFPGEKFMVANLPTQNEPLKVSPQTEISLANIVWRISIWKQTLEFASDSLLVGKGFGVYPTYKIWGVHQYPHDRYINSGIVPVHNHLITVLFKMGILGLGLFLAINIYVLRYALEYINKCKLEFMYNFIAGLLGMLVFWHIFALFFDVIDSPPTSIFLWIILGLLFAAVEIDKINLLKNKF